MSKKWNLQDIQPSRPPRRKRQAPPEHAPTQRTNSETHSSERSDNAGTIPVRNNNKHKRSMTIYIVAAFVVFIVAILVISYSMRGAEVTVEPQTREVTINSVMSGSPTPEPDSITYEILTLEKEGERQVNASGTENAESLAEGTITIYNEQSAEPVRLVTNTRFENEDGLVFRINDPAIVPGYTRDENGTIVPGTISADVFADDIGEDYNIKPSSFTIPGFSGSPEFETVYAESFESFTGGFDGERFIINDEDLNTATQALRTELRNTLLDELAAEQPAGFVVFPDAVTFTYNTLPSVAYGDDLAAIKEVATLRVPIFEESALAAFIAEASVPGYNDLPVRIEDPSVLTFSYVDPDMTATNIAQEERLMFKLVGKPFLVWEYDAEKLKTDLLNMHKSALPQVLDAYPAILRAEAVIRPFWRNKFPIDLEEVTVTEVLN